jgi:pimeloyl-ACP methyl ester carboxylesterase
MLIAGHLHWHPAPAAALVLALCAAPPAAAQSAPDRFVVQSDGHPLTVWARRPASPRGTILLVHGRTWSSRPDFDLQVPGLKRSVMASLAAAGFAAYAVDLRGYGATPRDETGWLTPTRAAADTLNVLAWIAQQHPTLPKPVLVGWSRGAATSMLAAQATPDRISALVLFGFAFDPDIPFADSTYPDKPPMIRNTAASAASDFVSPNVTPRAVVDAFVQQALESDPVNADVKNDGEFSALSPARLIVPTLVLYGERDVNVVAPDRGKFFDRIAAHDKQMIQLPGADHAAQIEDTHAAWIAAVVGFIERPPARR